MIFFETSWSWGEVVHSTPGNVQLHPTRLHPDRHFFFNVKTLHEVHFQSILFHSHILCKGLKSLLNPLPKSSRHIHGDDTLFHTAKKFHQTLKKSFFLPCKQTKR